jgi:hypothetical protein
VLTQEEFWFRRMVPIGEKPVAVEVIEAVLSRQIDDSEPKLMRHGYDVRILASQFNANWRKSGNSCKARSTPSAPGSSRIRCWRPASRCSRRAAPNRLIEWGSVPMISRPSHRMCVPWHYVGRRAAPVAVNLGRNGP